jgi:membrane-bound lytic murein transglycosylase A
MEPIPKTLSDVVKLDPVPFSRLDGWETDDHTAALYVFAASCKAIAGNQQTLRAGLPPPQKFFDLCRRVNKQSAPPDANSARMFFEKNFQPYRIGSKNSLTHDGEGFLTGYYEPEVPGSLVRTKKFTEPLLALPDDHVLTDNFTSLPDSLRDLTTARRDTAGVLRPYPDRAAIQAGALADAARPIVWLRDGIEAFMIHVQGSARIRLPGGKAVRVKYAGRNGHPYTSIGKELVRRYKFQPAKVNLAFLKNWVRAAGQNGSEPGRWLMNQNKSFIFFSIDNNLPENVGPIGAAGISLTAMRSIAVDRNIWPYGLPFWIASDLPWQTPKSTKFRRLMIGQDTGTAIKGPARGDIFFGSGVRAGMLAGSIRHPGQFFVLLPQ